MSKKAEKEDDTATTAAASNTVVDAEAVSADVANLEKATWLFEMTRRLCVRPNNAGEWQRRTDLARTALHDRMGQLARMVPRLQATHARLSRRIDEAHQRVRQLNDTDALCAAAVAPDEEEGEDGAVVLANELDAFDAMDAAYHRCIADMASACSHLLEAAVTQLSQESEEDATPTAATTEADARRIAERRWRSLHAEHAKRVERIDADVKRARRAYELSQWKRTRAILGRLGGGNEQAQEATQLLQTLRSILFKRFACALLVTRIEWAQALLDRVGGGGT